MTAEAWRLRSIYCLKSVSVEANAYRQWTTLLNALAGSVIAPPHSDQIGQDFGHVSNRQRVMPFAFDQPQLALRDPTRHISCDSDRKRAVFRSMPKPHRNIDIFQPKLPRFSKNLRVLNESFDRR